MTKRNENGELYDDSVIKEPSERRGKFIFQGIQESEGEEKKTIIFNPPLIIDYTILDKIDKKTGKENYTEDSPIMGFVTYDFGMEVIVSLDVEHNWLVNGYGGLTKESPLEDILMKSIFFDLFHSFCHPTEDPNYSHYHWALKGWLDERVTVR